jgi:hypothetical protein
VSADLYLTVQESCGTTFVLIANVASPHHLVNELVYTGKGGGETNNLDVLLAAAHSYLFSKGPPMI